MPSHFITRTRNKKLKHETKTPLDARRLNFLKPDEKFDIIGTKSNFTYDEFVEFLCKAEAAQSRALIRPHDTDGDGYLSGSEKDSWDAMAQKVQQKMTDFVRMLDFDRYYEFLNDLDDPSLFERKIGPRSNSVWSLVMTRLALEKMSIEVQ